MLDERWNFERLLDPIGVEEFRAQYWEQRPLWIKRSVADYFSPLFCSADVDQLLHCTRLVPPEVRPVRKQEELSPRVYLEHDGRLNLNQLYKAFGEGYSITVNDLHRFWPPAAQLCARLEQRLRYRAKANLYLTPRQAVALKPHFDTHDVFVLQIEGSKLWRLYESAQRVPLVGSFQPVLSSEHLGMPSLEVLLHAGDTLYVPRGFVHDVATVDEPSLHWTLGVYPLQWCDLLSQAIQAAAYQDEELRRAVPWHWPPLEADFPALADNFAQLTAKLQNSDLFARAIALATQEFLAQSVPPPDGHFAQLMTVDHLSLDSRVAHRPGLVCRLQSYGQDVALQFPGNLVRGPMHLSESLDYVARTPQFVVRSLPGPLTDEARIALVQRLIRSGLLYQVTSSSTPDASTNSE